MDSVIASIRIIAITNLYLAFTFHIYVLIARCDSLVYSEFKHTHYYTLDYTRVKLGEALL